MRLVIFVSLLHRLMAFSANDLEVASELYNTINDNDTITDKEKEEVSPPSASPAPSWLLCPFSVFPSSLLTL